MRFIYQMLLSLSVLLFPCLPYAQEGNLHGVTENRAVEIIDDIEHATTSGAGLYVVGEIFGDVGIGIGHQFALPKAFGFRVEAAHRLAEVKNLEDLTHLGVRRYGAFLDWQLADSGNFIYVGSSFNHSVASRHLTLESGLVLRLGERMAIRMGHEYSKLAQFDGQVLPQVGLTRFGRDHTFRFGVVHFFRGR